jgi:hypothetical protein
VCDHARLPVPGCCGTVDRRMLARIASGRVHLPRDTYGRIPLPLLGDRDAIQLVVGFHQLGERSLVLTSSETMIPTDDR